MQLTDLVIWQLSHTTPATLCWHAKEPEYYFQLIIYICTREQWLTRVG